jgi:hypothetical protein
MTITKVTDNMRDTVGVDKGGTGLTAVGTSGNVLTSNGSAWTSSALPASGGTQESFYSKLNSSPTISTGTSTKILWDNEVWDTASIFDIGNSKVVIPNGEKWFLMFAFYLQVGGSGQLGTTAIRKNGSDIHQGNWQVAGTYDLMGSQQILVEGDGSSYYECYVTQSSGSNKTLYNNSPTGFYGFKVK